MTRFIEGIDRRQSLILPPSLDDYVSESNPVRVVEVFIDQVNLAALGFAGVVPEATGRPSYHPFTILKIYLYGYLNRVQSSRRLERETQRNLELMWLTGRLMPDFKTIADFRRNNGPAIQAVCRQFVLLCRKLDLFAEATVAVDGSKFKAVNNRDKNFTPTKVQRRIEQVEESIRRYMEAMDAADRQEDTSSRSKSIRFAEKIADLKRQMQRFRDMEAAVQAAPDQQISLTDPDARSMSSSGKGTGIVGYNVQAAVDTRHHLIVAHEVTNHGSDRGHLASMGRQVQEAVGQSAITVLADRGYYKGEDIKDCIDAGITPYVPKTLTSGAKADGQFGKQDFAYLPRQDVYRCLAGETMKWWFNRVDEDGKELRHY